MKIRRALSLPAVILAACGSRELGPDVGGEPFWEAPALDRAIDLGGEIRPLEASELRPAGPPSFLDVTDAMGLADARAGGNQHGVGVAFVDLDGDSYPDIFVANGNDGDRTLGSRFYKNMAGVAFVDKTAEAGFEVLNGVDCFSAAAADYDADGDVDLLLGALPTDILFANDGTGKFTDVTRTARAGGPIADASLAIDGRSKIAAFGDMNGDGLYDIISSSSMLPEPYAYYLQNRGDGTFEDRTEAVGAKADSFGNPCAVMWSDFDNDADSDVWIWNDRGDRILLRNEDGERFEEVTGPAAVDDIDIDHPMGIDGADMDHDGDLDYYVSNIGDNPLIQNLGDGTFKDITGDAGTQGEFGWGLGFEDFDADTFADIFVAQEDNLPALIFRNSGDRTFESMRLPHPGVSSSVRAHNKPVAFADFDKDGRIDVVVAGTDGSRINLYRNTTELGSRRWLFISAPIGARVGVKTGDLMQFDEVNGGSSRASQNEHTVRFGLGDFTGAEQVFVLYPWGGQTLLTNVPGDQHLSIPR